MFKILNGDAPSYLQNPFSVHGSGYNLRNSEIKLNLPKPRTNYLKRSLCYSGALLWNNLPQNIRMLRSLPLFKNSLNYYTILYCIVLYCIVLYCIVLYCIVLYCIVLYCIVLYCIVLYFAGAEKRV